MGVTLRSAGAWRDALVRMIRHGLREYCRPGDRSRCSGTAPVSDQADPEGYVFISYARGDSELVDSLHRKLEAAGIAVWRDSASLSPGEDWRIKVRQAIADAAVFLACFSSRGSGRGRSYQNEEFLLAVEQVRQRPLALPGLSRSVSMSVPCRTMISGLAGLSALSGPLTCSGIALLKKPRD